MPRLENWSMSEIELPGSSYQAPELRKRYVLNGDVFKHPHFRDGTSVTTSSIKKVDKEKRLVYTCSGSVYTLGEPDPAYINHCKDFGNGDVADRFFERG